MNAPRSVTHGTCIVHGQHRDPKLRAECPTLRRQNRAQSSTRQSEAGGSQTPTRTAA